MTEAEREPSQPPEPPRPSEPPPPRRSTMPRNPPPGFGRPEKPGGIPGEREYLERRYGQR